MFEFDAVIPAAGLSSRMARFKPLAFLAGPSALERTVNLFRQGGVRDLVVVTGHRAGEVGAAAARFGARAVENKDHAQGMFTSVRAGVAALAPDCRAFFLLPVDIPLVRPETLARLLEAFDPEAILAAHPVFLGERGHPPLLSASLIPAILRASGQGGLRAVLEKEEAGAASKGKAVLDVSVPDEGVVLDMDSDEDFLFMERRAARLGIPSPRECRALWLEQDLGEITRQHCRSVARAALALARAVNAARPEGRGLDLGMVEAAALVHDLAKGQKRHEQEGARLLRERGFSGIADIVAAHRDIDPRDVDTITEREVVFMADKVMGGTELMPMEERYGRVMRRYASDPEATAAIQGRLDRAGGVRRLLEAEIGRPLWDVLRGEWSGE